MIKAKKILSAVLASVLAVGALSGCSEEKKNDGIKTVHIWSGDRGAKAVFDVLTEEFNRTTGKEKGMKIEWTYFTENYNTVLDSARNNGTLPEFFELAYAQRESYIETGDIVAIDDLEGGKEYLASNDWKKAENKNVFDNKTYSIMHSATCTGFIYNKDLFKAAGLVDENGEPTPPKTWEEVREYAKKLTNKDNGVYGYCFPQKFGWFYTLTGAFASTESEVNKVDTENVTYDYSGAKKMLDFICGVKSDGSMMPGPESLDNDTARAYFAEGKIGMMTAMSWDVGVLTDQFPATCDWAVAPIPANAGEENKGVYIDYSGMPLVGSKVKELGDDVAMEAIKFLTSLETRTALYESGTKVPALSDVLENVSPEAEVPEQLKQFSELVINSKYKVSSMPSVKIEGLSANEIYDKVFAGEMTSDEAVEDLSKRYTEALRKGIEKGEYTIDEFK